jgi:hypothetical protein
VRRTNGLSSWQENYLDEVKEMRRIAPHLEAAE